MGQSASKGVGKTAEKVARRVVDSAQPSGLPQVPKRATPTNVTKTTTANNPAMFLRGEGIAREDVRDKSQELYLQTVNKIDDKAKSEGPQDMPEDLLKFIQDVGPAKQSVDKEFTTPRLLEKKNEEELNKVESVRKTTRERIKMPLMGQDETFTTTRNTNFSKASREQDGEAEFGLSNLQLYHLIANPENAKASEIEKFHQDVIGEHGDSTWTSEDIQSHREMLTQAVKAVDVPVLRQDSDGTLFGLYAKEVPGPEVYSVQTISEAKIKLVLKDLSERTAEKDTVAQENLERRRQLRKGGNA